MPFLGLSPRIRPKLLVKTMRIYGDRINKSSIICSVCGGDHNVIIIPLNDGSRRIISPPFPNDETELTKLGLKFKRSQEGSRY